jgi:hypothetical protein
MEKVMLPTLLLSPQSMVTSPSKDLRVVRVYVVFRRGPM